MKTNVSIKFNSIKEYREIESKLEQLGYVNDKEWNEHELFIYQRGQVDIDNEPCNGNKTCLFTIFPHESDFVDIVYNSLQEFLND